MHKDREPRLTNTQVEAVRGYLSQGGRRKEITQLFATKLSRYGYSQMNAASIIKRMLNRNKSKRGGISEFQVRIFREATGVSEAEFEETVFGDPDFIEKTYRRGRATKGNGSLNELSEASDGDEGKQFAEFFGRGAVAYPVEIALPASRYFETPFLEKERLDWDFVKASAQITNLLSKMTGNTVCLLNRVPGDGPLRRPYSLSLGGNACTIVFHLSSYEYIHEIQDCFKPKVFSITPPNQEPKQTNTWDLADYLHIRGESNKTILQSVPTPPGGDASIILRVVSKPNSQPWFFCIGRTSRGVLAASYYLAQHWKQLWLTYQNSQKSFSKISMAAVIKHKRWTRNLPFTDSSLLTDIDQSGELYYWNDSKTKPAVAWGTYLPIQPKQSDSTNPSDNPANYRKPKINELF